jgi:hypothetical protein
LVVLVAVVDMCKLLVGRHSNQGLQGGDNFSVTHVVRVVVVRAVGVNTTTTSFKRWRRRCNQHHG